jgi:GT2 family glycosyltransferase
VGTLEVIGPGSLMSSLEVAVVIPTRNRETRLAFALEALAAQTLERDRFEVVVVRASDAAGPKAGPPDGLRVRFLRHSADGRPAAQRNRGWRATTAPLVAFTDDDCRPAPDWLERLLEASEGQDVFLQGQTEPDPDEHHLLHGLARSKEVIGPSAWYPTCNIAYPRGLLERLGGFDERFRFASGEDTDIALRARSVGAQRVYVHRAVVRHAVLARPLGRALKEATRWESLPLVLARHPAQRRAVYRRVFANRSHAALFLAAAGTLAARRSRVTAALAAVPYLGEKLDRDNVTPRGLVRQALHLPARLAVDIAELAATVRGAVKHRAFLV